MHRSAALVVILTALATAVVGARTMPEAQVKAGLLYNFAMFVTWPPDAAPANGDLVICLMGGDPLGQVAGEMTGRRVNNRKIDVTLLDDNDDPRNCHVLFVVDGSDRYIARILKRVGDAPVLTVGESPTFTNAGGVVRLYRDGGRMRFEVNMAQAQRAGLHMSSKVLSLARIVRSAESPAHPPDDLQEPLGW